jgi:hypothetical protein
MNEAILLILLVVGVIVLAATVWLAARSTARAKRAETPTQALPGREQSHPQAVDGSSAPPPEAPAAQPPAQPTTSVFRSESGENGVPDVPALLRSAYEQLSTRQHRIESELGRIEQLRVEREAVAVQVAALDQAMKAFSVAPALSYRNAPDVVEINGNVTAGKRPA